MKQIPLSIYLQLTGLTAFVLSLDQLTKIWALGELAETPWHPVPWFELTYSENPGIAFGLGFGGASLLVASVLLILLFIAYALTTLDLKRLSVKMGVSLVLGGAIGNFIDRCRLGIVQDFIRVGVWPTFNLADAAIVIGLLILLLFLYKTPHGRSS